MGPTEQKTISQIEHMGALAELERLREEVEHLRGLRDGEPIDGDWLVSKGFRRWPSNPYIFDKEYHDTSKQLELWQCAESNYSVTFCRLNLVRHVHTRGDVLQLCHAIGLPLD